MNLRRNKLVPLFLVFCLGVVSLNLQAKGRRGVEIIITVKDSLRLRSKLVTVLTAHGELIAVKPDSLLLLDDMGKDVSIAIPDIKEIHILKKSNGASGALIGFNMGMVAGVLSSLVFSKAPEPDTSQSFWKKARIGLIEAGIGGLAGAGMGALLGGTSRKEKKVYLEGLADSEIQHQMSLLRKKARFRDFR